MEINCTASTAYAPSLPVTSDGRQTPARVRLPSVVFLFAPLPSAQPSAAPPPVFHGVSPLPEDRHCAPVAVPSVLFAPLVAIPVSAYGIVRHQLRHNKVLSFRQLLYFLRPGTMSRVTTASLSIALQAIPRHVTGYDRITSLRSVGPKGQISLGIAITSLRYVETKD